MAVNVLHGRLLSFQERLVWHSLLPFFILLQFVFFYSFFVRINRALARTVQAFTGIIRKMVVIPPTLKQHFNNTPFCSAANLFIDQKI